MLALAQVVAGGEVLTVRGEDDHPDFRVVRGLVERVVQLVEQSRVLRVAGLGPVQHDARDVSAGCSTRIVVRSTIFSFQAVVRRARCGCR